MTLPDIPPFDPQFTQIPLGRNLLPLDDLQAAGGYDRQLILPDDLPPILSQGWTQGPVKPRLITGQDDGSVNVYVTGQKGGGSAAAPVVQSSDYNDTLSFNDGSNHLCASPLPALAALWGLHYVTMYYPPGNQSVHTPYRFYAWLTKHNDTAKQFFIAQGMWATGSTLPDMNKGWIEQEHWFPVGQDPSVFLSVTDGLYDLWCRSQLFPYDFEFMLKYA